MLYKNSNIQSYDILALDWHKRVSQFSVTSRCLIPPKLLKIYINILKNISLSNNNNITIQHKAFFIFP